MPIDPNKMRDAMVAAADQRSKDEAALAVALGQAVDAAKTTAAALGSAAQLAGKLATDDYNLSAALQSLQDVPVPVPPAALRDPFLWPFSVQSPWNRPLGDGATWDAGAATVQLRDRNKGRLWVNAGEWSHPFYRAALTDTKANVSAPSYPFPGSQGPMSYRIPANATPALPIMTSTQYSDRHMHVLSEDGVVIHEAIGMAGSGAVWTAVGLFATNPRGDGCSTGGSRASGVSAVGGLIRQAEADALNIPHVLAIALPETMLKRGWTWFALREDAPNSYSGLIPMGSLLGIPSTVDVTKLGLSVSGVVVATALQRYGARVVDRSQALSLYADPSLEKSTFLATIRANDRDLLQAALCVCTNDSAATPGGPGNRLAPLAPAI